MLHPTTTNSVNLAKLYDILGFLLYFVIQFKMFLQTLCEDKLEWNIATQGLTAWKVVLVECQLGGGTANFDSSMLL